MGSLNGAEGMSLRAHKKPCADCPWRTDVETGHFPPERFAALAGTAYDMSNRLFQCHDTTDENPVVCAGFLERGADHNLSIRMAYIAGKLERADRSGGHPLYDSFREMAVANGVDADDPALRHCRD